MKKVCLSTLFLSIFFLINFSEYAAAKESNVADCLENHANCSEEEKESLNNSEMEQEGTGFKERSTGTIIIDLLKMVLALFLVLALIYLFVKFLNKRNKLFQQVKSLENLGGVSVGQNKSVQIVRIGTKLYLIGVGDNVEMLHEITDEEVKKDLIRKEERTDLQTSSWLLSIFPTLNKDTNKEKQSEKEFKKLFSTELSKLKQTKDQFIRNKTQEEDKYE
ncbi:flagellar biosynthetic protein FliO [Virgibacillus alimentarius]|uniref:Flagellar protein FliO/FliZ n=1 Tax=Virgibacillus alimentarius TaxID=698769 RepID=A0ABS4S404_9BACI|nr:MULTISPECIES: flagellar biosynthetic protein FliO [Virgibacillus]MBP2256208.1 flagellar protein FliO/FliZ [Virgibacillus alimentarius]HLR66155.1 flagellar biosynthetic protein FliO [Virgibacillus sp.]